MRRGSRVALFRVSAGRVPPPRRSPGCRSGGTDTVARSATHGARASARVWRRPTHPPEGHGRHALHGGVSATTRVWWPSPWWRGKNICWNWEPAHVLRGGATPAPSLPPPSPTVALKKQSRQHPRRHARERPRHTPGSKSGPVPPQMSSSKDPTGVMRWVRSRQPYGQANQPPCPGWRHRHDQPPAALPRSRPALPTCRPHHLSRSLQTGLRPTPSRLAPARWLQRYGLGARLRAWPSGR